MRSIIFLIIISANSLYSQNQSGFQLSFAYGVDQDISTFYHSLPDYNQSEVLSQVLSKHPIKVSIDYSFGKGKLRYHVNGHIINRSIQNYSERIGRSGSKNHTMYGLGLGVSKVYNFGQNIKYEVGADIIGTWYIPNNYIFDVSQTQYLNGQIEILRRTIVSFRTYGIGDGSIVPMFNLYNQIVLPFSSKSNFLIGLGLNGQFNKAFSFNLNIVEVQQGQSFIDSNFYASKDFFMWFPYLKVGIQI